MKKLNLSQIIKLTKVLRKVGIKDFINTLEVDANVNWNEITVKIVIHMIENIECAENDLYELINDYKNIENANELDGDEIIEVFKEMFVNGVPKVIKDFFSSNDIKKKMEVVKKKQKK